MFESTDTPPLCECDISFIDKQQSAPHHVQCASSLLMVFPLLRKSICPLIQINVSAISCTLLLLRSYSQIKVSIRLGTSKASMHFVTFRCNYHGMGGLFNIITISLHYYLGFGGISALQL